MLPDEFPPLGKSQYKVQKHGGLEQPRNFIRPQDAPVKKVELAGIVQRVKNKRYQAENIEMGGTDRRPAPQQNVKPDSKVDERDQPQPIVHGALGRNQHNFHV